MNIFILIAILLFIAVLYLAKIERRLAEIARLQQAAVPLDVTKRLESEQLEAALFRRFIQEDFHRSEMGEQEKQEEFRKWKIANA
jgi:NADH:ubiquinone oxidoreductase subunit H